MQAGLRRKKKKYWYYDELNIFVKGIKLLRNNRVKIWASPHEKSKEKGQGQKVKFLCLNMKENKATGHKSTCWPHFYAFWDLVGYIGSRPNNVIFF